MRNVPIHVFGGSAHFSVRDEDIKYLSPDIQQKLQEFANLHPEVESYGFNPFACHGSVQRLHISTSDNPTTGWESPESDEHRKLRYAYNAKEAEWSKQLVEYLGGQWTYGQYCGATGIWSHPQVHSTGSLVINNTAALINSLDKKPGR